MGRLDMDVDKAISNTFTKTMREMFYVDLMVLPVPEINIENRVSFSIDLLKPLKGCLAVSFSGKMMRLLGKNIFDDERFDNDQLDDASMEFLNVFAGNLMETLFPEQLFEIGLGEKVEISLCDNKQYSSIYFSSPSGEIVALFYAVE